MQQTRAGSLIEAAFNILVGLGVNLTANALILPLMGWPISAEQNITLGVIYTAISLARSYIIRRWFNARLHAAAQAIARRRN